CQHSYGTPFTF
nr:immunoglobulin light chain junction region [Macaca mulatta]MOV77636.1 immunoglobulin light chain junction region [Macaca mulatta]MOV78058.1 immunoglobulin light chain junction region [Macaca mulatta]MOV78456.1 immunoglobulin light chain junction region [Macaca mulatta]MOV78724.1 immunoglobulin light chain junction region [Macaca mulatta]